MLEWYKQYCVACIDDSWALPYTKNLPKKMCFRNISYKSCGVGNPSQSVTFSTVHVCVQSKKGPGSQGVLVFAHWLIWYKNGS